MNGSKIMLAHHWRLINDWLKITSSLSLSEGVLFFIRGLWRTNGDKTRICVSYKR